MQISYRYTDEEYLRSRSVNKLVGVPNCFVLGVVSCSLIPSLLLALLFPSFLNLGSLAMIAALLFFAIRSCIWGQPQETDQKDRALVLTENSLQETHSHSKFEVLWPQFDELIEDELDFKLRRIERYIVLPKRIFSAKQQDEFRRLFHAGSVSANPEIGQPIELFQEHFQGNTNPKVQFVYAAEDLLYASLDKLLPVDTNQPIATAAPLPKKKRNWVWMIFVRSFIFVWVFLLILSLLDEGIAVATRWQTWILLAIIFSPFVLFFVATRLFRNQKLGDLPKLPTDLTNLTINKHGFAVGTPANTTFYDWRDVESFFENKSCYGFKTVNNLIQVVPKRVFADQIASEEFLKTAIQLQRESRRSEIVIAAAVESGNPYQSPAS